MRKKYDIINPKICKGKLNLRQNVKENISEEAIDSIQWNNFLLIETQYAVIR